MYGASVNFCTTVVDVNSKVFTTFVFCIYSIRYAYNLKI